MSFTLGDIFLNFRARTGEVDSAFDRVDRQATAFARSSRDRLLSRFDGDTRGIDAATQRAEGALRGFGERVRGFLMQSLTIPAGNFLGGLASQVKHMVTGSVIGMNASLEKSTIQFKTLMGDADKAKAHVAMLFAFAKDTPFETQPIIAASRTLQTFGGAALNNVKMLTLVGDSAAAVSEDIQRTGYWFGQLYSDLQGGNPFGDSSMTLQEMGIMAPEVRKQMEAMQAAGASADEIWAFFTKSIQKFNGAMIDQAQTWEGLTSTISDSLQMIGAQAGRPIFDLAKKGLTAFANALANPAVTAGAQHVANVLQFLIDTAGRLVSPFGKMIGVLTSGDFSGGIFGLREDSPFILGLLRAHDLLARLPALVTALTFGFQAGGLTGAALEVVTALGGIAARFGPIGQAITQIDLTARRAIAQVRMTLHALAQDAAEHVAILPRLSAGLQAVWAAAQAALRGGDIAGAFTAMLVTLGQQLAAAAPGLVARGRQLGVRLVDGLAQYIPEGLRSRMPLILGALTSVFAGIGFGPALAGMVVGLAPILAPVGAILAPLGGLLLGFGKSLGGIKTLLPGMGAAFRGLLNPLGLLRAGFGNLFTFLGVTGLKMVAIVANPMTALKLLFTGIGPALLGLKNPIGMLLGLGRTILSFFSPLGILITLVGLFAGAFATNFGGIQEIVATTLGPVLPILMELGRIFQDAIASALMGDWGSAFSILTGGFALLTPMIQGAATTLQTGLPQIFTVLMQFLGQIGTSVIGAIGAVLPGLITTLGTWATAFIAWVLPMIPPLLAAVGGLIGQLLDALGAALPGIVEALAAVGAQFVAWVGPQIPPLLIELGRLLASMLGWIVERAPGLLAQLGAWGLKLIEWVGPQIPPLLVALGGLLGAFLGWIVEKAPEILAKLGAWATQFAVWARDEAGPRLVAALGTMFTTLWEELKRLWGAAFADGALGASLISGLKQGIQDGWASFSTWFVSKLTALVPDWARGPLGMSAMDALPDGGGSSTEPPHRAGGGDVKKGVRYVVGEEGPEFFIAPADGRIEPNSVFRQATDPSNVINSALGWSDRPAPRIPRTSDRDPDLAGDAYNRLYADPAFRAIITRAGSDGLLAFRRMWETGNFEGGDFGVDEDHPLIAAILQARQANAQRASTPAATPAPAGNAVAAPVGPVSVHLEIHNPVVDSAERLETMKRQLLDEATRQFTAAVNRLTLSGV